jgi:hypothetical protein
MDTTFRVWDLTIVVGEGGQIECINGSFQTMKKDDVTAREDQYDHENEEFISRGEGSTSVEDGATSSVGGPTRKSIETGHQD